MPAADPARQSADWMSAGACRREDPDLFFPVTETHASAKAVCGRCLVRVTCLAYAMATGQDGVWGGTTGSERRAWRFSAGPQAAPGQAAGTRTAGRLTVPPDGITR
jgi:WhiB family transcriptional regulator, redox-sensing transcriptional regulator